MGSSHRRGATLHPLNDGSIPPWEPTPARLIPALDPGHHRSRQREPHSSVSPTTISKQANPRSVESWRRQRLHPGHHQPSAQDAGAGCGHEGQQMMSRRSSRMFPTVSRRHCAAAKRRPQCGRGCGRGAVSSPTQNSPRAEGVPQGCYLFSTNDIGVHVRARARSASSSATCPTRGHSD